MSGDRVPIEVATIWPAEADEEGIDEGVVVNWFAREGRQVDEGEAICEIQIEKVSIDVPAPASGTLVERTLEEDDTVARDAVLGYIEVD